MLGAGCPALEDAEADDAAAIAAKGRKTLSEAHTPHTGAFGKLLREIKFASCGKTPISVHNLFQVAGARKALGKMLAA